jgi:hypothetical protein
LDAVLVTYRTGSIKHVKTNTLEVFGYATAGELIQKNISMLLGDGEAAKQLIGVFWDQHLVSCIVALGQPRRSRTCGVVLFG